MKSPIRVLSKIAQTLLPETILVYLRPYISKNDSRITQILKHVEPEDSVLAIGCVRHSLSEHSWDSDKGDKFLFYELHKNNENVVGIDIKRSGVQKLQKAGFDARVSDAQNFDLNETFDTIVAGEVIEHLENPGNFLMCCKQHLKPKGSLILSTPNPRNLQMLLFFLLGKKNPGNPEHTMWYDWYVMRELTGRVDLEVENVQYYAPGFTPISLALYFLGIAPDLTAGGYIFTVKRRSG